MIRNPFLRTSPLVAGRRGLGLGLLSLALASAALVAGSPVGLALGIPAEACSSLRLSAGLLGFVAAAVLFAPRLGPVASLRSWASHLAGCAILSAAATLLLAGFLDGLLGAAR